MGIISSANKAAKAARAAAKIAADKAKRKDTVEKIKEAAKEAADKSKKKTYDGDKKATPSSTTRAVKAERSKAASEKASETSKKGTQGTGFRFASKKTTSEPAAGRVNARTIFILRIFLDSHRTDAWHAGLAPSSSNKRRQTHFLESSTYKGIVRVYQRLNFWARILVDADR